VQLSSTSRGKPEITYGLRVFENMVLRRILGPKRDEVTGKWRKLHNEELMVYTAHQILLER